MLVGLDDGITNTSSGLAKSMRRLNELLEQADSMLLIATIALSVWLSLSSLLLLPLPLLEKHTCH
jgi:hypothetical protein